MSAALAATILDRTPEQSHPVGRRVLDLRLMPAAAGAWGTAILVREAAAAGESIPSTVVLGGLGAGAGLLALLVLLAGRRIPHRVTTLVMQAGLVLAASLLVCTSASWQESRPLARALASVGEEDPVLAVVELSQEPRTVHGAFGDRRTAPATVTEVRPCPSCAVVHGRVHAVLWWAPSKHQAEPARREPGTGAPWILRAQAAEDAEGVSLTASSLRAAPGAQNPEEQDPGAGSLPERLRRSTGERALSFLDSDVAALATGMAYGDDSAISEQLQDRMKTAGLTHLTAVSGSNVALVLLLGVRAVRWTRCPRWLSIGCGLAGVLAYVGLVGADPSVLRAAVMGTLGAAAVLLGRGSALGGSLWVSVLVLTTTDPTLSVRVGFVLSVLATAGILVTGPACTRLLGLLLPRWLAEALALTFSATLWCSPYLIGLSGFIGSYTVLANLLAAPVVPFATAVGVLAVCLGWCPPVADLLLRIAGAGAWWIERVADWSCSWPGARLELGAEPWVLAVSALVSAVVCLVVGRADPARRTTMEQTPENLMLSLGAPRSSSSRPLT